MSLPDDAKARKNVPLYSGLIKYFPRALAAVAELSRIGNEQHNPGKPLHWDRSKSGDELDALTRHLFEAGTVDSDGVRHSTKTAWRALANLEKELEQVVGIDYTAEIDAIVEKRPFTPLPPLYLNARKHTRWEPILDQYHPDRDSGCNRPRYSGHNKGEKE